MEQLYWACNLDGDAVTTLTGGKYGVALVEPMVVRGVELHREADLLIPENAHAHFSWGVYGRYGCEGVFTIPGVQLADLGDLTATVYPLLSSGGNRIAFS